MSIKASYGKSVRISAGIGRCRKMPRFLVSLPGPRPAIRARQASGLAKAESGLNGVSIILRVIPREVANKAASDLDHHCIRVILIFGLRDQKGETVVAHVLPF